MTSTKEEIDTCQNNCACLGFQHPEALLCWGLSVCLGVGGEVMGPSTSFFNLSWQVL